MSNHTVKSGEMGTAPNPDGTKTHPMEINRRIFHLKTLYEASRELSIPGTPSDILKRFLPIAMGPLGLIFGFGVMLHDETILVECLGLDTQLKAQFVQTGAELINKFFPDRENALRKEGPAILAGSHLSLDPNLPADTTVVVAMQVDDNSFTILGFGPKLSDGPFSDDETRLLQGLATNLSNALKKRYADELVLNLNSSLNVKNEQMKQAIDQMEQVQKELNQRAFQLQTLYETIFELTTITSPKALLDAFALTLMGTFSYASAWIGLYGPRENKIEAVYRGSDPDTLRSLESIEGRARILTRFVELKDRMPHDNQACLLKDADAVEALPAAADTAVLFSLNHEWRGAIGLAAPLGEAAMTDEMEHLLLSLVGTFIVVLGNAKQMQLIRNLNTNLAARNFELQSTLDELTSAKQEIGILTEAKDRIVSLVHGEVTRVWKASWLDVSLIVLAGFVLGILFNFTSPSGIDVVPKSMLAPSPPVVNVHRAREMSTQDIVLIDARPAAFYTENHIAGALNLPEDLFDFVYSMTLSNLDFETPIIIYGRTVSRRYDADVARKLTLLGHENVMVLEGGLAAWVDAGYEVAQ